MSVWPAKDPDEILDYTITWELEDGETIVTSDFSVVDGDVEIDSDSVDGLVTTVWLSGGTVNTLCRVLNRIVTSEDRTYDKTVKLRIRTK